MQFVTNGPDIPNALLEAHEEGRVVFFCGAGVSYPAGLPGFKGLVEEIFKLNGTTPSNIEREAFDRNQFDATLDLLERRLPGQRLSVRHALVQALKPKLRRKGAVTTHAALLQLARNRDGGLRLVTTNFDNLFEIAAKRTKQHVQPYAAPMLPIPKNSRWNGLVYLHGQIPKNGDEASLHRLVVTSGDFGLAYLTERWAARFVSELFRNYVVCFVGYSINDPVLRYMMDALAADRMLGEITPQAWALGDCEPGQEERKTIEWEARGVTPILYSVVAGSNDHSLMHQTLQAWAEVHRDGVLGKERIVINHALARPSASTQQDDFVGRMLWALSDRSGLPAKRFADFNPVPQLDWLLESFSDTRFHHSDLTRFGVPALEEVDEKLSFSFIRRPAPYTLSPPLLLASGGVANCQWDDVMFHMARWLVRHLDDPKLIIWIAERGGHLHDRWAWMIDHELDRFSTMEAEGKHAELAEIRMNAPKAIPGKIMKVLWRLLLSGRVKNSWISTDLYRWKNLFRRDGLSTTVRLQLREFLSPKISVRKSFQWHSEVESSDAPSRVKQLVSWELVLAAEHVTTALPGIGDENWERALPALAEDFQQLLRDALDILQELGEADGRRDRSHWDMPSISPHWQNRRFRDWVCLIELVRDAWLTIRKIDNNRAIRLAENWFNIPYPTFKRLALFAASHEDSIPAERWLAWLLNDNAWWLWSTETKREVFRLLIMQGKTLPPDLFHHLETQILAGPPREMYVSDLTEKRWVELSARSVWLFLAKLNSEGIALSPAGISRLAEISTMHPHWKLAGNERDEFSHWMSGTGDPDYESIRDVEVAPRKRTELLQWLTAPHPEMRPYYEDTWREVCRTRLFHSLYALCDLAKNGNWPISRWREAFQVWSQDDLASRSWKYGAPLIQSMPISVLLEIAHSISSWIEAAAKKSDMHRDILLDLCCRLLSLPLQIDTGMTKNGEPMEEPVTEAINHPVGHVTQALINSWFRSNPNDSEGLPRDIEPIFSELCDIEVPRFKHGRVMLASQLIALFRVDRAWTEKNMLPLFVWDNRTEAKAAWEGFLWSPRLYPPLLLAFKQQLLQCSKHYSDLGEHQQQFSAFLTYLALGAVEGYETDELRAAFDALPQEGLEEAAQALYQALEGAGDTKDQYWKNRVLPFWRTLWPKSREHATPRIAESLTRLCIAAGPQFPNAVTEVKNWLQPIDHPDYIVHLLHESGLCLLFPEPSLHILELAIGKPNWIPSDLKMCLDTIAEAMPNLALDSRYLRLVELYRRQN
ncbi:anti-phage defense-associated sirtuin Dsr1 [Herbaspirillum huttiense]|uniref:anti-phage defense-associated sirtuin Dsr1 n=1 Tax=Herbaspirillum huttiense TaxID=863372 RepID=UPI002176B535|nr:anti-phage defense-associated sirtuin Dsr1 [Herbaspirillum huttiense]UWE15646.1 SIR2 family protein [Herbaspirillum huttiense]